MKKRIVLCIATATLLVAPLSAQSLSTKLNEHKHTKADTNIGLEFGTTNGVSFKYTVDDTIDIAGSVGLGVLNGQSIDISVYGLKELGKFEMEDAADDIHFLGGFGASANIATDGGDFAITPMANIGVEWGLNDNLPLDFYFRVFPGYQIVVSGDNLDSEAVIGATLGMYYRFL